MKKLDEDVNRRDFGKLALAAFGAAGCRLSVWQQLRVCRQQARGGGPGSPRLLRPQQLQGAGRQRQERLRGAGHLRYLGRGAADGRRLEAGPRQI